VQNETAFLVLISLSAKNKNKNKKKIINIFYLGFVKLGKWNGNANFGETLFSFLFFFCIVIVIVSSDNEKYEVKKISQLLIKSSFVVHHL